VAHFWNIPRNAIAKVKNSTPSTAHRPKCRHSSKTPNPTPTVKGSVCVNVRWPFSRRGSRRIFVRS